MKVLYNISDLYVLCKRNDFCLTSERSVIHQVNWFHQTSQNAATHLGLHWLHVANIFKWISRLRSLQ